MEYKESNFIYLKETNIEKYYGELIRAEYICEYFPSITKIIVRKVVEEFLKDLGKKYYLEYNLPIWSLLNNIRSAPKNLLPEEILNYIEIILVNGYEHETRNNKHKSISKHPIEILEIVHKVFLWYLENTEVKLREAYNFRAPSTVEYMEKEVSKIKEDLILKDNRINNLRQKIIELGSEAKIISDINNMIIDMKREKLSLEEAKVFLNKKIEIQKKQIADTEKNFKSYIKVIDKLKEKCKESQELLFEKESQLVKAEIQKQELNDLIKNLDERDNSIDKIDHYLQEELNIVRQAYEDLSKLTDRYQDIIETIEFSHDLELQKNLKIQKKNTKMEMNFQDNIFDENIINYNMNIAEAKRKVLIFKGILNEKIKREIKYKEFYRGFLKLKDKELRILYTIIINMNNEIGLISRSKELLLKSNEEKFIAALNKNLENLKEVSDDEIKLALYYRLMKLSSISMGSICNRMQFMRTLENMVDRAYDILLNQKDFIISERRLEAIIKYYFNKAVLAQKNKNPNLQINDKLVHKIYECIKELKQSKENIGRTMLYNDNKYDLDNMSEAVFKSSIKAQPFVFLSILIDLSNINLYKEIATIFLQVDELIVKGPFSIRYIENHGNQKFPNEYFIIILFLYTGIMNLNQQEELLSVVIMLILSVELTGENEIVNLEGHTRILDIWKLKQQRYNSILVEKEEEENALELLINERQALETEFEELTKCNDELVQNYINYKDEFKEIIMNSEKRILLPSYLNYDELRNKKEIAENNINESKNKFGTLKSMFSLEVWKDQASKLINESNMLEAEKKLIEEAKQKPYFKKEYSVFLELEKQIEEVKKAFLKNKEELKNKSISIDEMKNKINELQKQLDRIKDIYVDIEECY